METNEVTRLIVDTAYQIHTELGPGLLESVYEVVLASELSEHGLRVERQVPIPLRYKGKNFEEGFRADLIVEGRILIEIKSLEELKRVHKKQVLTYLKLTGLKIGLLINFGGEFLKGNVERFALGDAPQLPPSGLPKRRHI